MSGGWVRNDMIRRGRR